MKKGKIIWASLIIGTLGITLAACNNEHQPPVEVKVPYCEICESYRRGRCVYAHKSLEDENFKRYITDASDCWDFYPKQEE